MGRPLRAGRAGHRRRRAAPGPLRQPGPPQAAWIKSVAWAGVALGVIGLLLAVLKYTDALLGLPSAG